MATGATAPFANAEPSIDTRAGSTNDRCEVIELRQYTIRGGRRDAFIRLFASTFAAPQEALGIRILGWYSDLDDPDRFVWVRGFESMAQRPLALAAFYGSDLWKAHRDEANSMIVDSDNVLLLQPSGTARALDASAFRAATSQAPTVRAAIHYVSPRDLPEFSRFFDAHMADRIEADGGRLIARLRTLDEPNNFPKLPVRGGDSVFVWLAAFQGDAQRPAFERRWASETGWRDDAPDAVLPALMRKPEILRLLAPSEGTR